MHGKCFGTSIIHRAHEAEYVQDFLYTKRRPEMRRGRTRPAEELEGSAAPCEEGKSAEVKKLLRPCSEWEKKDSSAPDS